MTNPLLSPASLPAFAHVKPTDIEPALDQTLANNRAKLAELITIKDYRWDTVVQPLEDMAMQLSDVWSIVSHLNNVRNTPELRNAYNACLPKLTAYETELNQNEDLFKAFKAIKANSNWASLELPQQTVIEHSLRDFHLAGVDLPKEKNNVLPGYKNNLPNRQQNSKKIY